MLSKFQLEETDAIAVLDRDVFGRLTVLATGQKPGTYKYMAICQCSCGSKPFAVRFDNLISGNTLGCGCVQKERTTTHGMTSSGHYGRWRHMMNRCYDIGDPAYKNYGGRGIKVCERWHDIANFVADLPDGYHKGLEIDRIDNNGDYRPGNIRWATRQENTENRRSARLLTLNGETKSLTAWSRQYGLPVTIVRERIDELDWPLERALTEPIADRIENMRRAQSMRWAGHVKKPAPKPLVVKTFMFNGRMQTIREISQYTGISIELLRKRLCERKWPVDKATRII